MYTTPVRLPKLLLPREGIDPVKWAVMTRDQYTPASLQAVQEQIGDAPSSLYLTLPECMLQEPARLPEYTKKIQQTMLQYQTDGTLQEYPAGMMLLEHATDTGIRQGVLLAFDLEDYDNSENSQTFIRPTRTVSPARIAAHLAVREAASLELGHVMLLIDDPKCEIIEPLFQNRKPEDTAYDIDLMGQGGHLRSWFVPEGAETTALFDRLATLTDRDTFLKKYGLSSDISTFSYAVGDGHCAMATAKANWERIKPTLSEDEQETHPARFVLAELVNLYEDSVKLETIHPVLFHIHPREVFQAADAFFRIYGGMAYCGDPKTAPSTNVQSFPCFFHGEKTTFCVVDSPWSLPCGTIQNFLDDFLDKNPKSYVDYLRGAEAVQTAADDVRNVGFLLPTPEKKDLFRNIILQGPLPCQTFSVGQSPAKRYYMEARRIMP